MKTLISLFLLMASIFLSIKLFSQQSMGGVPLSIKNNLSSINIPIIPLTSLNNQTEMVKADSIKNLSCSDCQNNYYGKGIDVSIDIKNDGQMIELEDNSKLWILKVESSTALGMQFYFNKFKIPEMATLFIHNADSSVFLGAFTSENNPADTTQEIKFGTQPIKGNSIIIEYWEPNDVDFEGALQIIKVVHIFNDIILQGGPFAIGGGALPCNINVSCTLGNGWEKEINSVVLILGFNQNTDYAAQCSGAIINNTDEDGRVLLLTANHCIDGTGPTYNYSNWTFLFNHQTTTCSSDGSDVSGYTGQSVFGSTLLASDASGSPNSDYLLLDLNASKENMISYGACYAGWSLTTSPTAPFFGIHHPAGDVKKISKAPAINDFSSTHWRVDWTEGTTEFGSSGSPLFDNNHRIIGQDHYGKRPPGANWCDPSVLTGYGKFSTSWTHSGATGFAFYLDPQNTGKTSTDTYCPTNSTPDPTGGGVSCDVQMSDFTLNGSGAGIPCIQGDLILEAVGDCEKPAWRMPFTEIKEKCSDSDNSDKCKTLFGSKCKCKYVYYFIEIMNVDANFYLIGSAYSKWFRMQFDNTDDFSLPSIRIPQITIDQNKINALGISLVPGKLYRIKLANGNYGGWKEAVRYFRIKPTDISLTYTNLIAPFDFFNSLPWPPTGNTPVSNLLGRNITIDHISTNNDYGTNNIQILATNSISITNSVITAGFVASIVVDECGNFSGRMANPNSKEKDSVTENYSNTRIVYYNLKSPNAKEVIPVQNSKDKKPDEWVTKTNNETLPLLFPNPSSNGKFTFSEGNSLLINFNITVYNLLGEKIFLSETKPKSEIDISTQPRGIYFVKLTNGEEMSVQKIVYQ